MPEKKVKEVVNDVFGKGGLVQMDTSVDFSTKVKELETKYKEKVGPYLTEKVIPSIKEHVQNIRMSDNRLPMNWKNNHCEAMNHIFKLNLNWKPAKLPDLISMLEKEVRHQEALTRGALYGHGDYELAPEVSTLKVPISIWHQKTEKEKEHVYERFLKFRTRVKKENVMASTDGKLIIPYTSTVAKTPGQKRRIKDSKTFTMNKRIRTE